MIETYDPSLWDAIGGTVSGMYDQYRSAADLMSQGQLLAGLGALFGSSPMQRWDFSHTDGDYACTEQWTDWFLKDGCTVCATPPPSGN